MVMVLKMLWGSYKKGEDNEDDEDVARIVMMWPVLW